MQINKNYLFCPLCGHEVKYTSVRGGKCPSCYNHIDNLLLYSMEDENSRLLKLKGKQKFLLQRRVDGEWVNGFPDAINQHIIPCTKEMVLNAFRVHGIMSVLDVADKLNRDKQKVRWHINTLCKEGQIERFKKDKTKPYSAYTFKVI